MALATRHAKTAQRSHEDNKAVPNPGIWVEGWHLNNNIVLTYRALATSLSFTPLRSAIFLFLLSATSDR